jgi:hypothetical protein
VAAEVIISTYARILSIVAKKRQSDAFVALSRNGAPLQVF